MRFQYRTGASAQTPFRVAASAPTPCVPAPMVQVAPLAAPRMAKPRTSRSKRPAAKPRKLFVHGMIGGAVVVAAAGCASLNADVAKAWKIEPVLNVTHAISSSSAYYALGRYHDGAQAWDQAIDAYRKAIIIDTQNIEAYNALGVALARSGRYAPAEATLRQALVFAPDKNHVRNNLGYVLLLAGKPEDAVTQLKAAVQQDPGSSIAMANLSYALAQSEAVRTAAAQANGSAHELPVPAMVSVPAPISIAEVPAPMVLAHIGLPTAPQAATVAAALPVAAPQIPAQAPTTVASAAAALRPASQELASRLEVSNGNGVAGMAARVGRWLAAEGLHNARLTNQRPFVQQSTLIQYRSGHEANAQRVARSLPANAKTAAAPTPGLNSDVRLVIGRDWVLTTAGVEQRNVPPVVTAMLAADTAVPALRVLPAR